MPQLHLYLPDDLAERIKKKAGQEGLSLSKYLASIVTRDCGLDEWPPGYFEKVVGKWKGNLERPPQGKLEKRDSFDRDFCSTPTFA
jgi:hypothetical protein